MKLESEKLQGLGRVANGMTGGNLEDTVICNGKHQTFEQLNG